MHDPDYDRLSEDQKVRLAALRSVRDGLPELDAFDLIRVAAWVVYDYDPDASINLEPVTPAQVERWEQIDASGSTRVFTDA